MRGKFRTKTIVWAGSCVLLIGLLSSFGKTRTTVIPFLVPEGWPAPVYDFENNPVTTEGFELGRKLFFDPILSRDSTIACVNCHLPNSNFSHTDHRISHGIEGRKGTRNSHALVNLAWSETFMWDGAINHIEVQPLAPIEGEAEMDHSLAGVVERLKQAKEYQALFKAAYGKRTKITGQLVLKSFAQYLLMLVSENSKYDQVMRGDSSVQFTPDEANGLEVFRTHCISCHPEPLFTTGEFVNIGLPVDTFLNDVGRMKITGKVSDSLKFKVPSLRNVQASLPYMHDGRFHSLKRAIAHYGEGIQNSPTLATELQGMSLTEEEQHVLGRFLRTLTDKQFLKSREFWPEWRPGGK